jgi:bifunctional DNase/RNase
MSDVTCQWPACDLSATMHFEFEEGLRVVEASHFCDSHGRLHADEMRKRYYSPSRIGAGSPATIGNGVSFGIDFLFMDELQEPPYGYCRVGLMEFGGNRKIDFQIGPCEFSALGFELQRHESPRPPTHRAVAAVIAALGARLQYVEIDKFLPSQSTYEAKLHIQQLKSSLIVDVRPSDALVLAVICDVPVIVSNTVLNPLPESRT